MYCPRCAAQVAGTAARCPECDLDVLPIAHLLHEPTRSAREERWRKQRHALGLLAIMCSLLVGCFIPIGIGVFGGSAYAGSLILILAGVAGALLFCGAMLILASENAILTSNSPSDTHSAPAGTPLLADGALPGASYAERARHPADG